MEKWYSKKGFKKNPLHVKAVFDQILYGYDILVDELFYRISSGNMIFIEGSVAKTSLMYRIIEEFKGKGKVAYVNCSKLSEELNIKELLSNGKKNMRTRMPGLPKRMIVLLDNVNELSEKNAEMIKFYFDQDNIQSILMTGNSFDKSSIPESIKHRIGKRVYQTREPTFEEAVEIILSRISYQPFISQLQVEKIVRKNYKEGFIKILQEVNAALFLMVNAHEDMMSDGIINRLLHMPKEERDAYEFN